MKEWLGKTIFVLVVAMLAFFFIQGQPALVSQTKGLGAAMDGSAGPLSVLSTTLPSGVQQIVVTDTATRAMAVYHVEPQQGKLQLKSVRSLAWDLRMEEFNGQSPLPSELRAIQP